MYLGLLVLDISKIFMYEYWCDHTKPKYGDSVQHCYVDGSFIIHVESQGVSDDLVGDVEQSMKY